MSLKLCCRGMIDTYHICFLGTPQGVPTTQETADTSLWLQRLGCSHGTCRSRQMWLVLGGCWWDTSQTPEGCTLKVAGIHLSSSFKKHQFCPRKRCRNVYHMCCGSQNKLTVIKYETCAPLKIHKYVRYFRRGCCVFLSFTMTLYVFINTYPSLQYTDKVPAAI